MKTHNSNLENAKKFNNHFINHKYITYFTNQIKISYLKFTFSFLFFVILSNSAFSQLNWTIATNSYHQTTSFSNVNGVLSGLASGNYRFTVTANGIQLGNSGYPLTRSTLGLGQFEWTQGNYTFLTNGLQNCDFQFNIGGNTSPCQIYNMTVTFFTPFGQNVGSKNFTLNICSQPVMTSTLLNVQNTSINPCGAPTLIRNVNINSLKQLQINPQLCSVGAISIAINEYNTSTCSTVPNTLQWGFPPTNITPQTLTLTSSMFNNYNFQLNKTYMLAIFLGPKGSNCFQNQTFVSYIVFKIVP